MISMLVSFSLTPMMCSRMLQAAQSRSTANSGQRSEPTTGHDAASRRGFYRWIDGCYMVCLR